jgi:hypothetical protein
MSYFSTYFRAFQALRPTVYRALDSITITNFLLGLKLFFGPEIGYLG